jgi:hypothetical protein
MGTSLPVQKLVSVILIVFFAFAPLGAQAPANDVNVWRALAEKLEPGTFVVVTLRDGKRVRGHFIQLSGESLRIKPKTRISVPPRDLALADIDLVQRQKEGWSSGRKVATGVAIGAGVLFLLTAIAFAAGYD